MLLILIAIWLCFKYATSDSITRAFHISRAGLVTFVFLLRNSVDTVMYCILSSRELQEPKWLIIKWSGHCVAIQGCNYSVSFLAAHLSSRFCRNDTEMNRGPWNLLSRSERRWCSNRLTLIRMVSSRSRSACWYRIVGESDDKRDESRDACRSPPPTRLAARRFTSPQLMVCYSFFPGQAGKAFRGFLVANAVNWRMFLNYARYQRSWTILDS